MRLAISATSLGILLATPALAETALAETGPPPANAAADRDIAERDIIVTALRTPVVRDRIASSVTVLDEEAIQREQPIALSDLLVRTPGVSMARNGGFGTSTSLRIRGADPDQTVLVIDGMRLADPSSTGGGYNFAHLLVGDAARVEILRGPQSILWGSHAIGGVVNVVSQRPQAPVEGSFDVEAGSRQTVHSRAAIGGTSKAVDWRLAGSAFTTDGISARSNGTEDDGYRRYGGSGRVTVRISENLSADLRGYYADARSEFDGSSGDTPAYSLHREWTGYAGLNLTLLDGRLRNRLAILETDTDRRNMDPRRLIRQMNYSAEGRIRRYEYQGDLALSDQWSLVLGAEREEQRLESGSPGNDDMAFVPLIAEADIDSVYAQLRVMPFARLTISGGARHDSHSDYGGETVFSAGAAWTPGASGTVLRVSYAEGFKAPTLYQLFSDYGFDGLDPERAKNWEAGVEQALLGDRVRLSAAYFERDTDNLIDFAYCPSGGPLPAECYIPGTDVERFGYYANVNRSEARGLELAGAAAFGGLRIDANYSWIAAEDRSEGPNFGNQLARTPRHLANVSADYRFPFDVTVGVSARYSGESFDRAQSSVGSRPDVLDDYTLVDLRTQVELAPGLGAFGRIENLFDTGFATARGYGTLGRSVYLGVRGRF